MALVTGFDIGGAHLKLAQLDSGICTAARELQCRLWEGLDRLHQALDIGLAGLPAPALCAVTMTGELVDLFPSRATGVEALLGALARRLPAAEIAVYAGDAGWLAPAEAARRPAAIASMNWHASAAFVAAGVDHGLFVDVGSTTTDILRLRDRAVLAAAGDDAGRLTTGELVYTGLTRTPLMALADRVPFGGRWVSTMAEYFATTADVWRILGLLDEAADLHPAADNGPKTREASARRLARMVGADLEDASMAAWEAVARWYAHRQITLIEEGVALLLSREPMAEDWPLVTAGAGAPIVDALAHRLRRPRRRAQDLVRAAADLQPAVATCFPAVAVASLLATRSA